MTTAELAERLGWGRIVAGRLFGHTGGIKGIADRAQSVIGANMNRTSLGEVLRLEAAPTEGVIGFRAWVLLTALGENPEEWGVPGSVVPAASDPTKLAELLYAPGDSNPEPSDCVIEAVAA